MKSPKIAGNPQKIQNHKEMKMKCLGNGNEVSEISEMKFLKYLKYICALFIRTMCVCEAFRMYTVQQRCVVNDKWPNKIGNAISHPLFHDALRKLDSNRESTCIVLRKFSFLASLL